MSDLEVMEIGFLISWLVTLTSAMALVICVRELVAVGIDIWESRKIKNLDHWLSGTRSGGDLTLADLDSREYILTTEQFSSLVSTVSQRESRMALSDDEVQSLRHLAVMLSLGFVAALGTVFGLLTLA